MALRAMATVAARNVGGGAGRTKPPTGKELLETIGTYIPTDISTLYIAVAGGVAAITPAVPNDVKLNFATGFAILAAFAMWVLVHRAAQRDADDPKNPPNFVQTLAAGWYEILTAPVAMFVWATAMPASWWNWGPYSAVGPAAAVGITTIAIGGVAVLLNRNRS